MAVVNRALTGPININCDHSDSMGARDAGWIQIYAENNQEAYDNYIQAFRIAEHSDVRLPFMACQDGFITSHAVENIELLEDDLVKKFVGDYEPEQFLLNAKIPMAVGPYANSPFYMETKMNQRLAMKNAKKVILEVASEFEKISGRKYGFFEEYKTEDADFVIVIMGSAAGTTKDAVDRLREQGIKAGVLKIRVFRPFPGEEIATALKNARAIAIMDRAESFSAYGGPLGSEVKSALFDAKLSIDTVNYFYGLGGRDYTVEAATEIFNDLQDIADKKTEPVQFKYIGLRK
ncbi:MAG: transketolase C-terminal domain-containing protein, partial [Lachnospiraceae bacterium]|nr:transketolase C-terminal domain-containing protein [Lachnospiraceae bacterium]